MQDTKEINKVVYLNNNDILPNRFQPRKYFDEEEIMQLSESIKEHGVINPIIVRKLGDKYELVAGERRYKANILAGNDDIPAIIMDVNDKESSEIAVVENIQRKDLNAIEEAISYKRILDIGYMTQENLAQKMGKSQAAIANKIRLLKLSDEVQDALMKKEISERHARSLLKLESHKKQNELLERIISERLTVRKTDEEIEKMNNNMNVNLNNMYNSTPDNGLNTITPVMPGTNVSDVNISGTPGEPMISNTVNNNNGFENNTINSVEPITTAPIVEQPANEIPTVEQNMNQQPENNNVQTIPTVSIDDVLAKANQPSVVGNQSFVSTPTPVQNVVNNQQTDVGIPNLEPINEEPTPINDANNTNFDFNIPSIEPENDTTNISGITNFNSMPAPSQIGVDNNEQNSFEMPNLNQTSDNQNSIFGSVNIEEDKGINSIPSANTDVTFNNSENINSPINTSPIIDTMSVENNDPSNTSNVNNAPSIDSNSNIQPQSQFEKVPEPIIVNEYNDQYDPIMPKQQNAQPTIDFKTIINLIRKCSQAIENSGYKIETEEYNLDNLYQVVFKIDKQ